MRLAGVVVGGRPAGVVVGERQQLNRCPAVGGGARAAGVGIELGSDERAAGGGGAAFGTYGLHMSDVPGVLLAGPGGAVGEVAENGDPCLEIGELCLELADGAGLADGSGVAEQRAVVAGGPPVAVDAEAEDGHEDDEHDCGD